MSELPFQEDVLENPQVKELKTWKGHILETKWLAECVKYEYVVTKKLHLCYVQLQSITYWETFFTGLILLCRKPFMKFQN